MKLPFESLIRGLGTVGIGVPSHVIVIVESAVKEAPTTVVDANPVSGTRDRYGMIAISIDKMLLSVSVSPGTVSATAVIV